MKAAICTRYGAPEVIQILEVPTPTPKAKEVLIRIKSTAVNSGDVRVRGMQVAGLMKVMMRLAIGFSKPRQPILGTVYAGVVESVGSKVTEFKSGDRVFGMSGFQFGTHAEYIAVPEKANISLMPNQASFEEAASLIFGGQTAIYFLEKAKLEQKPNPKVLIIGATGSVGSAAVQLAAMYNAEVTAVCSSAGLPLIKTLDIKNIILYDQTDFTKSAQRYDFIFDAVGKATKKQCRPLLAPKGVFKSVEGLDYASESRMQLAIIKSQFEQGKYKAVIDRSYSLDQIVEAHHYVDSGRKKGNVIINISE